MGLITYIQGYSAIIAVVLMPFLVKSRVPAYWVLYLLFCTILTPLVGVSSISDLYPQEIGTVLCPSSVCYYICITN